MGDNTASYRNPDRILMAWPVETQYGTQTSTSIRFCSHAPNMFVKYRASFPAKNVKIIFFIIVTVRFLMMK